jgi:hypothetical protein
METSSHCEVHAGDWEQSWSSAFLFFQKAMLAYLRANRILSFQTGESHLGAQLTKITPS